MGRKKNALVRGEEEYCFKQKKYRKCPRSHYIRWNKKENEEYASFVLKNLDSLKNLEIRKTSAIFTRMASQLKNGRNNHQCRSHHVSMV